MILFATCDEFNHPTPSLERLLTALRSRGFQAEHRQWKHTDINEFAKADVTLPLCFWDYHGAIRHFINWVNAVESQGGRIINSPDVLRWNFRKTYLLDLSQAQLSIPFTKHIEDVSAKKIRDLMEREGLETAVIKPVIGQNGHDVIKLDFQDYPSWENLTYPHHEALFQEYLPAIVKVGETTLTFIEGEFSHAIRRVLPENEWRANQQFDVQYKLVSAPHTIVNSAKAYLDQIPGEALYARVDGIIYSDRFELMELELIDPYLYLELAPPEATEKLANAIIGQMQI